MKIAIIVGDPEVSDKFLISTRDWLQNIPKSHISGPAGPYAILKNNLSLKKDIYDKNGTYIFIYLSVYYYLVEHYWNYHAFDLIFPKEISYDRLIKYDLVFYNFFDPVAQATIDVKKALKYEALLRSLPSDKVYPPISFIDVQHDKCKYYSYLQKNKIPIVPTFCVTMEDWNSKDKKSIVNFVFSESSKLGFKQTFVKPIMGTSGTFTTLFPYPDESESAAKSRIFKHFSQVFKKNHPKIVIQEYISGFATESIEMRLLYVGETYQYTIVSTSIGNGWGEADGMAALKSEGGTFSLAPKTLAKAKALASKVLKAIQPLYEKYPKLVTRVDIGCCLSGGKMFVNEIEYAPAFFTSWFTNRNTNMIDVTLAKQIFTIANSYSSLKKKMYPLKIKINNKKPKFAPLLKMKTFGTSSKSSLLNPSFLPKAKIYILGCYKDLCKKNPQMHTRLLWMNKYMIDAGVNMSNVKLMSIFWKDDFTREYLLSKKILQNSNDYPKLREGEIGNFLSHINTLLTFMKTNDPYCIIIEDDIQLKPDFMSKLQKLLKEIQKKKISCDLLWLHNNGYAQYNNWNKFLNIDNSNVQPLRFTKPITSTVPLYKMSKNFVGSTALYLISRRAAAHILNTVLPIGIKPTNVFMQSNIPSNYVHLSVGKAVHLMDDSFEGVFCYSDTDESLIQLNRSIA